MNPPLVSVVTPCFNAEPYLAATLQSVVAQTLQAWELIVVDDGSTDASREVLARWSGEDRRITWQERRNPVSGPSNCRNQGLSAARGRYVLFLDADDLLAPHCLQTRMTFMETHPECQFAVFQMQLMDRNGRPLAEFVTRHCKDYLGAFVSFAIPWQTSGPLWRTDFVRCLGGFDARLPLMEDPHLHFRAILSLRGVPRGYWVMANGTPDAYYRVTGKHRPFQRVAAATIAYLPDVARRLQEAHLFKQYRTRLRSVIFVFWKYMAQSLKYERLSVSIYVSLLREFHLTAWDAGVLARCEALFVVVFATLCLRTQRHRSTRFRHAALSMLRHRYRSE